ncbi:hypothetical protein GCM10029964_119280 [Kibdelosporangium lantanae]
MGSLGEIGPCPSGTRGAALAGDNRLVGQCAHPPPSLLVADGDRRVHAVAKVRPRVRVDLPVFRPAIVDGCGPGTRSGRPAVNDFNRQAAATGSTVRIRGRDPPPR